MSNDQPNFKELEESIDLISKEGTGTEEPKGFLESANDD